MEIAPRRLHGRMTHPGELLALEVDGRLLRAEQRRTRTDVEADINWFQHLFDRRCWEMLLEDGRLMVIWHHPPSGE